MVSLDPERVAELNLPTVDAICSNTPVLAMKDKEGPIHPFVLNEALPVVPAKQVRKNLILKGEILDMCELLKDTIEAERRRSLSASTYIPESLFRGNMREVPDLLSWLQCFSLYAGEVINQYPEKAKDLFAYQALIIYEARCNGGHE